MNTEYSKVNMNIEIENERSRSIPSLFSYESDEQGPSKPRDSMVPATEPSNHILCHEKAIMASSAYFESVVEEVKLAISIGIFPSRIPKGSSGSYFCRNRDGIIVAVFKPKDEEPYGSQNPKLTKWFHRNLLPCCFGRSCIVPNLGYISEAAASFIDRRLGLNIVPRTEIVRLRSPSFHYSFHDRLATYLFGLELPEKIGSFQLFVDGYTDSTAFFKDGYSIDKQKSYWSENTKREFQYCFERLVILDYLIRNTDRSSDNWMIKSSSPESSSSSSIIDDLNGDAPLTRIQIAGIDHGLAFPTSHPQRVRSYPYGWLRLPIVRQSFSKETADYILPFLTSQSWWEITTKGLERLFKLDDDFQPSIFANQKAVVRGQGYNLVDILFLARLCETSPLDLVQKPSVMIHEDEDFDGDGEGVDEQDPILQAHDLPLSPARRFLLNQQKSLTKVRQRLETDIKRALFQNC